MKWYHFIASFFAGAFLANALPHLVRGISGDAFPSPFSNPPGKGLSSPTVNVIWGLANLLIGYLLLRFGKVASEKKWSLILLFVGITCMAVMLSIKFEQRMH